MYRIELGKIAESIGRGGADPIKSFYSRFIDDIDSSDDFSSTSAAPALTERRNSSSSFDSMTVEDADSSKDLLYNVGLLTVPKRSAYFKSFDSMIVEDSGSESDST
eukprot:GHVP01031039.1.p1 GENE.GHVP01031039.1~~GHVP01031039.1.p1  ORF type:complete len:106 (+),score=14.12 GHVP01031039.1:449-766(+)